MVNHPSAVAHKEPIVGQTSCKRAVYAHNLNFEPDAGHHSFGADIVKDGSLDRAELARRAFADKESTHALNAATHPEITRLAVEELHKAQGTGAKAAVIDAALLFDSDLASLCLKTAAVIAPESERIERIMKRDGISLEDAALRAGAQPSAEYYKEKADIIINNSNGADTAAEAKKITL